MQSLQYWQHYRIQRDFILYFNHDSLWHIQSQKHLNAKHSRWVNFLQQFYFVLKHKAGAKNKAPDALSRRVTLLNILTDTTTRLDSIKSESVIDVKLSPIYTALASSNNLDYPDYSLKNGFLFHHNHLCLPAASIQELIAKEMHSSGIAGYFGRDKTVQLVEDKSYWPNLK